MNKQKFCEGCNQKHHCQDVYRQLGTTEGPSIVRKVVAAFLLPMAVFIASLAAFAQILSKFTNKEMQTVLSFVAAALATFFYVLIARAITRQADKSK